MKHVNWDGVANEAYFLHSVVLPTETKKHLINTK